MSKQRKLKATSRKANAYVEQLRSRPTKAERVMCQLLDHAKVSYVFQSPVYDRSGCLFIADFRIRRVNKPKMFVEIDGGYHNGRESYDAWRQKWIQQHRQAVVLRFTNAQVFERPDEVMAKIFSYEPALKTSTVSCTSCASQVIRNAVEAVAHG